MGPRIGAIGIASFQIHPAQHGHKMFEKMEKRTGAETLNDEINQIPLGGSRKNKPKGAQQLKGSGL